VSDQLIDEYLHELKVAAWVRQLPTPRADALEKETRERIAGVIAGTLLSYALVNGGSFAYEFERVMTAVAGRTGLNPLFGIDTTLESGPLAWLRIFGV
jgi:hypothetical protein